MHDQANEPRQDYTDVSAWGWTGEFSADELHDIVQVGLELLFHGEDWVNRRVETIHLIDEERVRINLSVDFRLPLGLPPGVELGNEALYFLPITFMKRAASSSYFDVRDEQGASLPLLTRENNGLLTGSLLAAAAEKVLKQWARQAPAEAGLELSDDARTYLVAIPTRPRTSLAMLRSLMDRTDRVMYPDPRVAQALFAHDEFKRLLALASRTSVIHVPLRTAPGQRRIVKLSWELRWSTARPAERRTKGRFEAIPLAFAGVAGWRGYSPWLERPFVGSAQAYHLQVSLPSGVHMTEVGLTTVDPATALEAIAGSEASGESTPETTVIQQRGLRRTGHLYLDRARGASQVRSGIVWVTIRATRQDFFPGATAISLLVALILVLLWRNAADVQAESETVAAVLLVVPAVMAGWLVQPGQHGMASRLLRGPRYLMAAVASVPLMAAALLVAVSDPEPAGLMRLLIPAPEPDWKLSLGWLLLAVCAAVLASFMAISWIFPRSVTTSNGPPADHKDLYERDLPAAERDIDG